MNNPFSRLKHFIPDLNDPQENHATECLGACLVFSPAIRSAFIQFLLKGKPNLDGGDTSEVEVETQRSIGTSGQVDLVLQKQSRFIIAVEVKVKAPENCQHHREQLKNYREWLNGQKPHQGYLFTLVRNPDKTFDPVQHGADGRRSWWELYKSLKEMKKGELSAVEESLIENFCEYLESEGIVSTYSTKDLLFYSEGLKARKAIAGILNQLSSKLQADGFQSIFEDGKDYAWPILKIEHPNWKRVFGKGQNQKLSLWFMVPGIWEAQRHDFRFEIELVHEDHGNDWETLKPQLPKWLDSLKSQGFDWTVWETWKRSKGNLSASKVFSEPKRINAWKHEPDTILDQKLPENEDELLNRLVALTRQHADIVSSLAKDGEASR